MAKPRVVVIGAGPAGLTAAYELAKAGVTDVVVLEATRDVGGLSKTVNYKGNRIDIGGTGSSPSRIGSWTGGSTCCRWPRTPPQRPPARRRFSPTTDSDVRLIRRFVPGASVERVMLVRSRLSRIYFNGKFF